MIRITVLKLLAALLFLSVIAGAGAGCAGGSKRGPEVGGPESGTGGGRLRVLSYNIHHGEGTDGQLDLDRLRRIIARSGADLVALQEVDHRTARTGGIDQPGTIAAGLGFQHVFGEAIPFEGGSYGEAVLTRTKLLSVRRIPLGAPPDQEARAAVEVFIEPWGDGAGTIRFIGTHLSHESQGTRLLQVAELKTSLEGNPLPAILAGDFNSTPSGGPYLLLAEGWLDAAQAAGNPAPTFPSASPEHRIDYIFLRPAERWRVVSVEVLDEPVASDHRPLLVELELLPAAP